MTEKPVNIRELAEWLGVEVATVYHYNTLGLPRFRAGKQMKYLTSEVVKWLKQRTMGSNSEFDEMGFVNGVS